ncbi:thermonuclease family protein [Pseudomonas anguilliseptica]|uniref:Endonuclease YncB, thermonuclease family n=1 Tax=Pseudomonas anguilliseptica TaxID=53406 RepID=A0A1H5F469_PSEAG|nr:thermonuclease family protein [Pseudomonas anguilliseptica]SED98152.1 Endonuclease YncB, thermonuclease family [Pseudomonas anguilliseptica]
MSRLILLPALLLLACCSAIAAPVTCKVVAISDGDTLTCLTAERTQIKVRLAEIDTPEKAQPYGQKSKAALSALVFGKQVTLATQAKDRYGRIVARVSAGGQDANREMVRLGAAWVYRQYSKDKSLLAVEAEAQASRRGLWALPQADIVPPWEWRKAGKQLNQQVASSKSVTASSSAYQCGAKRYCKQMTSCAEAKYHLTQCGMAGLDRDGDGKPCENVCN